MNEKIETVSVKIEVEFPVDVLKCVEKTLKQKKETLQDVVTDAMMEYGMSEYILYLFENGMPIEEISRKVGKHVQGCMSHIKYAKQCREDTE